MRVYLCCRSGHHQCKVPDLLLFEVELATFTLYYLVLQVGREDLVEEPGKVRQARRVVVPGQVGLPCVDGRTGRGEHGHGDPGRADHPDHERRHRVL